MEKNDRAQRERERERERERAEEIVQTERESRGDRDRDRKTDRQTDRQRNRVGRVSVFREEYKETQYNVEMGVVDGGVIENQRK